MALNCERVDPKNPTGEPCGECAICERVWSGSANLDVVEIDAASNRSVDDARDLRERAMYAASQENGYKVYIVDEAHMLTREAWNALLKILEEPPPRVVFVFATTEPQKIANTAAPVLSRLQRFDFKRIGAAAIRDRVRFVLAAEKLEADDDAIAVIARYADGGMRDALSVLDQALSLSEGRLTADRVRQALGLIGDEVYAQVLDAVARKDAGAIFPVVDALLAAGADLVEFVNGMAELLRAVLMTATGVEPEGLTSSQREVIAAAREHLSAGDLLRMLGLLTQVETAIRRSANPRLVVETLLLRWTMMDRTVDIETVLRGAGTAERAPSRPEPRVEARPPAQAPPRSEPRVEPRAESRPRRADGPGEPAPEVRELIREPGPIKLEALAGSWPEIVARARERSPLFGAVVEHLRVGAIDGSRVSLSAAPDGEHMLEGAKRQQPLLEELLSTAVGSRVTVTMTEGPQPVPTGSDRPKRLSEKDMKAERLKELRGKDRALDAAADALDLEIVD